MSADISAIVLDCIRRFTGYTLAQLRTDDRREVIARARLIAYLLLSELTHSNQGAVASLLHRNHGSVSVGIKRIKGLCDAYPETRAEVEEMRAMCRDAIAKKVGF